MGNEIKELLVKTKSGNELSFRNFEDYCGRSISSSLLTSKSEGQLQPLKSNTVSKTHASDGLTAVPELEPWQALIDASDTTAALTDPLTVPVPASGSLDLTFGTLSIFSRAIGSRRDSLRQLLGTSKLSLDTQHPLDSPRRTKSLITMRGQKLDRSASVSPHKSHSSATNCRRVKFFPIDVGSTILRRGVSGSEIPSGTVSVSEKVGPTSTATLRSISALNVTSEKVRSSILKKPARPGGSFGTALNALPPELLRTFSTDTAEDHKFRTSASASSSVCKSSSMIATVRPLRCRSIDAILPKSSEKVTHSSRTLVPKSSEKIHSKNLLVPLSARL